MEKTPRHTHSQLPPHSYLENQASIDISVHGGVCLLKKCVLFFFYFFFIFFLFQVTLFNFEK